MNQIFPSTSQWLQNTSFDKSDIACVGICILAILYLLYRKWKDKNKDPHGE